MKKSTKIFLWISIPLVLAIGFFGPRVGLFGDKKGSERAAIAAAPAKGQMQKPGTPGPGNQQGAAVLPVTAIIAKPSYLSNGIRTGGGTLLANEELDIVSKVAGKVTGVFFKEGSLVKKGNLLVKIYDDDLQAQLRRSEIQEKMLSEKLG
ncbi:MAG TPA: biotin/lipoyl-binding protein, partial [Bacteroidales bacterium]|nr:biotin/lipoyl-binding protein [Bacteroidales bacterium]